MKNFNNRAKATIAMITSFGLALSLMSCTSCDIKTGSPPVSIPETSAAGSAVSEVSAVSAVSEVTESSEESVAISDSVATSESTSASTARQATPTPKPTSTPKVTATPRPTTTPGRTAAQAAAPTPTPKPVSAGTNNVAAATPTPVPTATPAPVPTATPTPKPTATPTPTPTKVSVYSTFQIGWDSNIRADAASRGIDLDAEAPVERGVDIYAYDDSRNSKCGAVIDSSDADAAVTRMYAAADAILTKYGYPTGYYGYTTIDEDITYLYD